MNKTTTIMSLIILLLPMTGGCYGAKSEMRSPEPVITGDAKTDTPVFIDIIMDYVELNETASEELELPFEIRQEEFEEYAEVETETTEEAEEMNPCSQPCDDGINCTQDSCDPSTGCIFTPVNENCNDGIDCTTDVCDPASGCIYTVNDSLCDDGINCTVDRCIVELGGCVNRADNSLCNDSIDCTTDICSIEDGDCIFVPDDSLCNDSIDCTVDECDSEEGCVFIPDDSLCQPGERCDPDCNGCILDVAPAGRFLAHSSSSLYQIEPTSPSSFYVGDILSSDVTDIAVTPDIRLWGVTFSYLISIDYCTGEGSFVGNIGATSSINALVADPDGWLYGADLNGNLWQIDPTTGSGRLVGNYGWGLSSSGDLAWGADGNLYATAVANWSPSTDVLLRVNTETASATIVGDIGFSAVYGLAFMHGNLYGLTNAGQLIQIDTLTGRGTLVGVIGSSFWGAASPP